LNRVPVAAAIALGPEHIADLAWIPKLNRAGGAFLRSTFCVHFSKRPDEEIDLTFWPRNFSCSRDLGQRRAASSIAMVTAAGRLGFRAALLIGKTLALLETGFRG
jgi:hypothetical protein